MEASPQLLSLVERLIKNQNTGRIHNEVFFYPVEIVLDQGQSEEDPMMGSFVPSERDFPGPDLTTDLLFDIPRKRFASSEMAMTAFATDMTSESRFFVESDTAYLRAFVVPNKSGQALLDRWTQQEEALADRSVTDIPDPEEDAGQEWAEVAPDERWARMPLQHLFPVIDIDHFLAGASPTKILALLRDERVDLLRFEAISEGMSVLEMILPLDVLNTHTPTLVARLAKFEMSDQEADVHLIFEIDTDHEALIRERVELLFEDGALVESQSRYYGYGAPAPIAPPAASDCYPAIPKIPATILSIEPSDIEQTLELAIGATSVTGDNNWSSMLLDPLKPEPVMLEPGEQIQLFDLHWVEDEDTSGSGNRVQMDTMAFVSQRGGGELLIEPDVWKALPSTPATAGDLPFPILQNDDSPVHQRDDLTINARGSATITSVKTTKQNGFCRMRALDGEEFELVLDLLHLSADFGVGSAVSLFRFWLNGDLITYRAEAQEQVIFALWLGQASYITLAYLRGT